MNFRKAFSLTIATLVVLIFAGLAVADATRAHTQLETKHLELQSTQDKIKLLQLQYGELESKLQKAEDSQSTSVEQLKQLQQQKEDLDKQLQTVQAQLQAKANAKQNSASVAYAAEPSKEQLMASAGIAAGDYYYADYIITRESGWRECVRNGGAVDCNYSGELAYGLCQSLPGNKMASAGADWKSNSITQLKWCNGYAISRYGSWYAACNFWKANGWW